MGISTQNKSDALKTRRRGDAETIGETSPRLRVSASPRSNIGRFVPKISGRLWATFLLIAASTLVPSAIILWLDGRPRPLKEFFITPFVSLVYATCIGGLLSIGLNQFLRRFVDAGLLVKILFLIVLITAATGLGFFLGSSILLGLNALLDFRFFNVDWGTWRISLFMGLLFGVIMFVNDSLKLRLEKTELELRTRQLAETRAKNLAVEARLSSLESRVRPHFLFNTLNSISALIRENPEQAERTVERLSALLRFSLDAANQKTVSLGEEIKIVRDYLEIEKTRFGERLRFSLEIDSAAENFAVPPFALQTLVENSIKHAVSNNRKGGEIVVYARVENDFLHLSVSDDGAGFDESAISAGHGLDNLQARLTALYSRAADLQIERRDEQLTVVSLIIPKREAN